MAVRQDFIRLAGGFSEVGDQGPQFLAQIIYVLKRRSHLRPGIRNQSARLFQCGRKIRSIPRIQKFIDAVERHFQFRGPGVQRLNELLRVRGEIVDLLGQGVEVDVILGRK
jgi:hypothetical protein